MLEACILTAIRERLSDLLAPPVSVDCTFVVDGEPLGYTDAARARRLARFAGVFDVRLGRIEFVPALSDVQSRSAGLAEVAAELAREGALTRWRNERYGVAAKFGAPPRFYLERAAARYFGVATYAAHVNGCSAGFAQLWFARRAPDKAIDPGMLDNLVGGGIAEGASVPDTVVKEASEEAGIERPLAVQARPAGSVRIFRQQPDGVQRETIFVHDLVLPPAFNPVNRDGEVVAFRRVDLAGAAALIARSSGPDQVTADASLVVLDFLLRHAAIAPGAPEYCALDALRLNRA